MAEKTKTDRWSRIERLFQGAVDRSPSERAEFLKKACAGDEALRLEVESLLANDNNATTAIDSLVAGDLRVIAQSSDAAEIGLRVGPYRLVRELDSGGMGVVYLAVRSDDQYFQIVAIKMIRRGVESPALYCFLSF